MIFNKEFYPTPADLIDKMFSSIDFGMIESVLEPSAGKGNIADALVQKLKSGHGKYNKTDWDIDCVEIDENLQHILRGKGYRVIHNDFLTLNTFKKYDLILMNPPFSNGDKHLLKAIEMQRKGGQIVCLLNAETIDNPYTNSRKDLIQKLEQYEAQVEFIDDAFLDAERKTPVRIALVRIDIRQIEEESIILDNLRQEEQYEAEQAATDSYRQVIDADFVRGIVEQYNFEVKAGLKLIAEWRALKPLMLGSFTDGYDKDSILQLRLKHEKRYSRDTGLENKYIEEVRMKYWRALFSSEQFMGIFTSNLQSEYYNKVNELRDYDFSLYNIYTIRIQLSHEMVKAIEQTILDLFEEFSHKHYYAESSSNIHYYNGWKTNKCWKVNNRVIIPLQGFNEYSGRFELMGYKIEAKILDIEKVFNYLDGGKTDEWDSRGTLERAVAIDQSKNIELKYFTVTFYKKGTCHIKFLDEELLHKFNLFGSQRKGWLPPSYGKAKYADMDREEQKIIDEFEGKKSYDKVMQNKDYYLVDTTQLLQLTAGGI